MQTFHKYTSINNPKSKYLDEFSELGYTTDSNEWVALEKIHGSNFSFVCNGDTVTVAKRSGPIEPDEKFCEWQRIQAKYTNDIKLLYHEVKEIEPNVQNIQVFGEIFGGYYPGEEVVASPVQKGVYYSAMIDFMVFDIRLDQLDGSYYLAQDEVARLLAGLPTLRGIPVMARGKLNELLELSTDFATTIPSLYNLPSIDSNKAEGIVIKLNQRHPITKNPRPIIKNKNEKFAEVAHAKKPVNPVARTESFALAEKIIPYCTQNRFNNVISKIGANQKVQLLQGRFVADIIEDFEADTETIPKYYVKPIKKFLLRYLNKSKLVNVWLKEFNDSIIAD